VRSGPDSESGLGVEAPVDPLLATLALVARSGTERVPLLVELGLPLGTGMLGGHRGDEVVLSSHALCRAGRPGGAAGAWLTDAGGDVADGLSRSTTTGAGELVDLQALCQTLLAFTVTGPPPTAGILMPVGGPSGMLTIFFTLPFAVGFGLVEVPCTLGAPLARFPFDLPGAAAGGGEGPPPCPASAHAADPTTG
jgi:hypothetical protein